MAVDINAMRKSQSTVAIDLVNDKFTEKMSNIQLLDYIALVLARNMASNIAFKGGWVLRQIMEGHARATKDVDLSAETEKSYDEVKAVLKEIGQLLQARGMIDEFVIKEEIKPTQSGVSQCIRMALLLLVWMLVCITYIMAFSIMSLIMGLTLLR